MDDSNESTESSSHKQDFSLNVISPSPEVGRLNFPSISTSCTVAQLKQKISDASETRIPLPSQQRLIYRGHVLAQEQRTLRDIFGQEAIDGTNEPLTVHLVFNAGPNHSHASGSSTPQSRVQQSSPSQPTQTNPTASIPGVPAGSAPSTAPEAGPQHQPLFGRNPQIPAPPMNPFPHLQQTFAMMNQQMAAQLAALGAAPAPNVAPGTTQPQRPMFQYNPNPPQQHHNQTQPQPPMFQYNPHPPQQHHTQAPHNQGQMFQPHMPPGNRVQSNPNLTSQQALHQHMAQQSYLRQQHQIRPGTADQIQMNPTTPRPSSAPPPGLGNTNTVIRETYGPNGERHQSIVSSGTIQVNRGGQLPTSGLRPRGSSRHSASRTGTPNSNIQLSNQPQNTQSSPDAPPSDMRLQLINAHLMSMDVAMSLGTIPPDSVQEQVQNLLRSVATTTDQQQYQALESRRSALVNRAAMMRRNLDAQLNRAAEQITSQRNGQGTEESAIYLLSSSAGPQALLITPSGHFTAQLPTASVPITRPIGLPDPPIVHGPQNGIFNAQQGHINAAQLAQVQPDARQPERMADPPPLFPNPQAPQPQALHQAQQPVQQEGQGPNPARDIVRILIPLGGHLWLLIRLFGFVYFFTHGASWYRTILLSLVAVLLFISQSGLFQPLLQTLWGPIRRHAEALLPLAGNDPPQRRNAALAANNQEADGQGRNREPTPQQAAERLLREREAQDGNFVHQGLRRMERAVALFVASLVPGVGERHVAAREAAEAVRQQQEREREESARREQEATQQAEEAESNSDSTQENAAASGSAESTDGAPPAPEQAAQPPLVDI